MLSLPNQLKDHLGSMFSSAMEGNRRNILSQLRPDPHSKLLDLGCDDGVWSMQLATRIGVRDVHGVEIVPERAAQARERGVQITIGDLAEPLPFEDSSFDVVHANQVIEHVPSVDMFTAEIFRVLRPGGYCIISTENASSWHNVIATTLGWQMFSLTNVSALRSGLGNPLALHRNEACELSSWTHKVIFSYRGLTEFLSQHGFVDLDVRGSGYYPLPARVGRLDARHAHFLSVRGTKPLANG